MKARWLPAFFAALLAVPVARAGSPESEEYRDPSVDEAARAAADSAAALAVAERDSLLADSLARASARPGAPLLPHPALVPYPGGSGGSGGSGDAVGAAARPTLALLPTARGAARGGGPVERETVSEALRLGAEQAGSHRVLTAEETARPFGRRARVPKDCFDGRCALRAARKVGADFILVSELSKTRPGEVRPQAGPVSELLLALVETRTGKVRRAARARACPGVDSPIPFAQQAVWHLLPGSAPAPEADSADGSIAAAPVDASADPPALGAAAPPVSGACGLIADIVLDSGSWAEIPWLNARDSVDLRRHWAWAGAGALAAGIGMAWAQGQLLQEDPNASSPSGPLLPGDGAATWMRGFFAAPNLGARHAALGGAGIAHADDALAVMLNPAGVADAWRENAVAARRSLPGGAPAFNLAYAGPLKAGWFQGLAVQHEGDDLANESTLQAALAGDWGGLVRALAGFKSGAALKVYLAKVGVAGTGLDRSTGHSFGMGLDLGIKLPLTDRITGAASVRDLFGFLRHANTFTDRIAWELLPPEYRLGAAYRVDPATLLVLDGQKGLVADQADHVRLGGERVLFGFLALRAGLHQAYGRETVRTMSAGFGVDSEGLSDRSVRTRIAINYAYEFGMDEDAPLASGQSFSMQVGW